MTTTYPDVLESGRGVWGPEVEVYTESGESSNVWSQVGRGSSRVPRSGGEERGTRLGRRGRVERDFWG